MSTYTSPISGRYAADPIHSSVGFAVKYMGASTFRGTFDRGRRQRDRQRLPHDQGSHAPDRRPLADEVTIKLALVAKE
jgi:hypothetical protein